LERSAQKRIGGNVCIEPRIANVAAEIAAEIAAIAAIAATAVAHRKKFSMKQSVCNF
jgi:hypothetical protein